MGIQRRVIIKNPQGLHARPASIFVKIANQYNAEINVSKDGEKINGKSMMGILTLACEQGSEVELEASGPDEEKAMDALEQFLLSTQEPTDTEGLV